MNVENKIQWLELPGAAGARDVARPEAAQGAFAESLNHAVAELDKLQTDADSEVRQVAMGGGNLHEMAIALEKADIGMRLATKVRNKVVEAYHEIMKMGV